VLQYSKFEVSGLTGFAFILSKNAACPSATGE